MNIIRYGWKCPECGTIHAPFIPECRCNKKKDQHECHKHDSYIEKSKNNSNINDIPSPKSQDWLHEEVRIASINEDINVSWLDPEGTQG